MNNFVERTRVLFLEKKDSNAEENKKDVASLRRNLGVRSNRENVHILQVSLAKRYSPSHQKSTSAGRRQVDSMQGFQACIVSGDLKTRPQGGALRGNILTIVGSALLIGLSGLGCAQEKEPYHQVSFDEARARMVDEQILGLGVRDSLTLRAMRSVPRHAFVPSSEVAFAYEDRPLPIGFGQTISQPYIVAIMTEMINPGSCAKVLEVGTGSGYQAAVLAEIVDSVFTIEIIPELAAAAGHILDSLGYHNVSVRSGDGYLGWPEQAPYDAIIVTAAPDHIPQPLVDQLKNGGTMVIPVGAVGSVQALTMVTKKGGVVKTEIVLPVRFVPLTRQR